MASINTAIQLTDMMTAPLMHISNALNMTISSFESMQSACNSSFDGSEFNEVRMEIERANSAMDSLERGIDESSAAQKNFNQTVQQGSSHFDGLGKKIMGVVATYAGLQTVGKVLDLSDSMAQTEARLSLIVDDGGSVDALEQQILASAQRSRADYMQTTDVVAKLGQRAGDAFSSNAETIQFAENLNKQFAISGASQQEMQSASLQLTQALGSGVLRGEELNAVFESAPNVIQTIADYLNVPIGQIRNMASEGEITADIVKNAMLGATDEINAKFEQMPMTFGQVWTSIKNTALKAFQPVLKMLNNIANSDSFDQLVSGVTSALVVLSSIVIEIFDLITQVAGFMSDNWSVISPIVYGVVAALTAYYGAQLLANGISLAAKGIHMAMAAAGMIRLVLIGALTSATAAETAAQCGLNSAMYACPIVWIIMLIIAAIAAVYAIIAAYNKWSGMSISATAIICGSLNVVLQLIKNLGALAANIFLAIGLAGNALGENIMTAFHNAICSVQSWFYDLLSTALTVVEGICSALNKLPFVEFDYSSISSAADDYAAKSAEAAGNKNEYKDIGAAFTEGMNTFDAFEKNWVSDAFDSGTKFGEGIDAKIKNIDLDMSKTIKMPKVQKSAEIANNTEAIANNTGSTAESAAKTANSVSVSAENLKYLRDISERDNINKYTTAEINVEMINNNTVNSDMDLDGISEHLRTKIEEEMQSSAEGVH